MGDLLSKTWSVFTRPDQALEACRDESPRSTVIYLVWWSLWLAVMTAITNLLGFPCNLLHSGTNPQLFAYHDLGPLLVDATGVPLWIWMVPLVWVLMLLFVPLVSLFYHLLFKLLGGEGGYWQTVRFFIYPGTPVFVLGWVPFIGGTLAAFWTAAMYPLGLRRLHRFSWGLAVLFVGILMGVQIGRIFLTGEWYGIPVQ